MNDYPKPVPLLDDDFDTPFFWLGCDALAVAEAIRGQHQAEIERLLMVPEGFDLLDPQADE